MKNTVFNQTYSYPEAKLITIVNHMSALVIQASETDQLSVIAELSYPDYIDDIEVGDFITVSYKNGEINIELEEIDELEEIHHRKESFKLQILLPKLPTVKLESENCSFNISGIESDIALTIENGACVISNCKGSLKLESENGPLKLHNHTGDLRVTMENGPLSTDGLSGDSLYVESENGAVKMRSCAFTNVDIKNENGVIYYETLPVDNAEFSFENENGVINLVLPAVWGFEITTETDMGVLRNKLDAPAVKVGDTYVISSGDKEAIIRIKTENGVIKIGHDKHLNMDYLRTKIDQLKEAILGSKDSADKANVQKLVDQIIVYVNRGINAIHEEKIRDAVNSSITKLKEAADGFDVNETKDKIIVTVESIGNEIQGAFQEFISTFQDKYNGEYIKDFKERIFRHGGQHHGNFVDPELGERITEKVFKTMRKVMPGAFDLKEQERQEIAEQSRLKILGMLESGKITAEEAERLLKAISKE